MKTESGHLNRHSFGNSPRGHSAFELVSSSRTFKHARAFHIRGCSKSASSLQFARIQSQVGRVVAFRGRQGNPVTAAKAQSSKAQ